MKSLVSDCISDIDNSILGICGCGVPEGTYNVINDILNAQLIEDFHKRESVLKSISDNYGLIQFVLYILDNVGILDHGSSIGGAWLSEFGKHYKVLLETYLENEED